MLLLLLVEWMSGCRQESMCSTSTDRLVSGSLRLLTDTKETRAHSLPHAHSHFETLTLSVGAFGDRCSPSLQTEGEKTLLPRSSVAAACTAMLDALFSDTKDVQQSL